MTFHTQQPMTIRVQQISPTEVSITLEPPAAQRIPQPGDPDYVAPVPREEVRAMLREGLSPAEIAGRLCIPRHRVIREQRRLQERQLAF